MANLQIKNVPEELHQRLRQRARQQRRPMGDVALEAIARELDRVAWNAHLETRAPVELGVPAADLLSQERADRDSERSR